AVIEQLAQDLPRVAFRVVTADPLSVVERDLRQRQVELAVAPLNGLEKAPDIEIEPLFDDRQVIIAGANSRWARRHGIALPALLREPWVLPPPESIIGSQIAEAFSVAGIEPHRSQIESFSVPL